jgi:hypothetical protein
MCFSANDAIPLAQGRATFSELAEEAKAGAEKIIPMQAIQRRRIAQVEEEEVPEMGRPFMARAPRPVETPYALASLRARLAALTPGPEALHQHIVKAKGMDTGLRRCDGAFRSCFRPYSGKLSNVA